MRRGTTPPAAMFEEMRTAILSLQQVASRNIFPLEQSQNVTGIDQDQMQRQSCRVRETITIRVHYRRIRERLSSHNILSVTQTET